MSWSKSTCCLWKVLHHHPFGRTCNHSLIYFSKVTTMRSGVLSHDLNKPVPVLTLYLNVGFADYIYDFGITLTWLEGVSAALGKVAFKVALVWASCLLAQGFR